MNRWVTLLSLIAANLVPQPAPIVKTKYGQVRGKISDNAKFYQYSGVPYGRVDQSNRFQAPLPPLKWDGVLDVMDENTRCPQRMFGSMILGEADCLKLHIYTPVRASKNILLPVMVYIHGGCFFEGTGSGFLYGGDFFAEHGVVFVGLNYRLNAEGFLCLGIKEAPGNAGLKDQLAALKWVKENIKAFGGDPDNVTLFGESAGAVSTSFLILSEAAKGLFHKVILQSGSTLAPWGLQHDPITTASTVAREFGINTRDPRQLYNIISNKTVNEIISAIKYSKRHNYITAETLFVPCVEREIDGVEPIVTKHPAEIIRQGNYTKVPMVIGYNDKEGIYFVAKDYGTTASKVYIEEIFQPDLVFPSQKAKNVSEELVYDHYFSSDNEEKIMDILEVYSDLHFKIPSVFEAKLYAETTDQPIYYYQFKHSGYINMAKVISRFGFVQGASHADEIFYLFKPHAFPLPQRYLENTVINTMVTMWTNFAKYSNPTPNITSVTPTKWEPSRASNPLALIIEDDLTIAPMWNEDAVDLWTKIYRKYRRRRYGFSKKTNFKI